MTIADRITVDPLSVAGVLAFVVFEPVSWMSSTCWRQA